MLYKLRMDVETDADGAQRLSYGMDIYQKIRSISPISTDKNCTVKLVELCNALQPEEIHLDDIITDAMHS